MTDRPEGSPWVVPPMLFQQTRMYRNQINFSLASTVIRAGILCVLMTSIVAAPAAAVPVPKSRPSVERLHTSASEMRGAPAENSRLGTRLATRLRSLSRLLGRAGLDIDRLVADAPTLAGQLSEGRGGPLVPAAGRGAGRATERSAAAELNRVRRMQNVLLAMPLAAPMIEYKLNSGFGFRRDPFRRRGAVHTGLDFGGSRNAPIHVTAPGTVVESGRAGAYGIMVVVDHGMGIETRYAHLSRALVRVGDRVTTGRTVGIMGRTGRATGHHLHYEIRVDGRPLNPKPFIEAGNKLRLAGG